MNITALWKENWKKNSFRIVVILECILLILGIIGLFVPVKNMAVTPGQEGISLSPGIYHVKIKYQASEDGNQLSVYDTFNTTGSVLFGTVTLYSGNNEENCQMWVLKNTDHVRVEVNHLTNGELEVEELMISGTNGAYRIWIFLVLLFSLLINGFLIFRTFDQKIGVKTEHKRIWGVLIAAFFLSCIPVMVNYNLWGDDWGFHLLRVEGLISGLKDGQFPVRVQGNWLRGYGYAVSVFYSDMFMVIPMIFRLLGFTVNMSCRLFAVVINGATLLLAYECFRRVFKNRTVGCVSAVLYLFSAYRMHNLFMRAAIGEVLAMVFLPVVFYGFYRILTDDIHQKEYRKNWLVLSLGLTGIIQSHVLTCEMLALVILILCVLFLKKVFRKETFWLLVKTVIVTLLLNLWYLVPFADYMLTGKFNVGHAETMTIKEVADYGLYLTHLLFLFFGQGTQGKIEGIGMNHTGAFSVGAGLLLAFFVWLFLEINGNLKKSKVEETQFRFVGLGRLAFGYTCLFFVLVLDIFPWYTIQHLGGVMEMLSLSLQFPWRFLSLAGLSCSVLAGVVLMYLKSTQKKEVFAGWVVLFTVIALFFGLYQSNMQLFTRGFARVYNKQSMGTIYVSNGEYLPYEAQIDLMICDRVIPGEGVTVTDYVKGQDTLRTEIEVKNSGKESFVELPLLYYKGYAAQDVETKQKFSVVLGDNSALRVMLPEGYSGRIRVWFGSLWYWRAAEVISLLSAVWVVLTYFYRVRRKNHEEVAMVEA